MKIETEIEIKTPVFVFDNENVPRSGCVSQINATIYYTGEVEVEYIVSIPALHEASVRRKREDVFLTIDELLGRVQTMVSK